ncbi:MAG TPA: hypothetical protein VHC95_06990 [Opitutales bacterium]|nr:hypothetical protein [Opitutales bacterium]
MDTVAQTPVTPAEGPPPEAAEMLPPWVARLQAQFPGQQIVNPERPNHPLLPFPDALAAKLIHEGGLDRFNDYSMRRNRRLRLERVNPLEYGFECVSWKLADVLWGWITWDQFCADPDVPDRWKTEACKQLAAERRNLILVLGGWRASKTEYMIKRAVQCALKYPEARIWLLHENQAQSVQYHHRGVYKYLPADQRDLGRGKVEYVAFTWKNGFTANNLVLRNKSTIEFKTYEQYAAKDTAFEGAELGDNERRPCLGALADELIPFNAWDALRARLTTRSATGLTGFYPKHGYNETVAAFLQGATLLLSEPVDGVIAKKGDRVDDVVISEERVVESDLLLRGGDSRRAIVHFFSKFNPFGNYPQLLVNFAGESLEGKLATLAGRAFKTIKAQFPKFKDSIHLADPGAIPLHGTNWLIIDPAGTKNWFMLWIRVDLYKRFWVYREWPCKKIHIPGIGYPEPWAIPGAEGGMLGGGARSFGFTLANYKNEIARLEGWGDFVEGKLAMDDWDDLNGAAERVRARILDHRYCETTQQNSKGNTNLLMELLKLKVRAIPGPAMNIDPGVQLINDRLGYTDKWLMAAPKDRLVNEGPKLFISRDCENLIFALKTWTRVGGADEPTKDPIDALRYACQHQIFYAEEPDASTAARAHGYGLPRRAT